MTEDESWKLELKSFGKLCRPVFWVDRALTEFYNFEIFNAAAEEKTKICRDKNSSFQWSGQFSFAASAERPIIKFVFASRVKKVLNEKKAKSDRENNLIYHQKLPEVWETCRV